MSFNGSVTRRRDYFVEVCVPGQALAEGWPAFLAAHAAIRGRKVVYVRHRVTPVGITTVFQLVP